MARFNEGDTVYDADEDVYGRVVEVFPLDGGQGTPQTYLVKWDDQNEAWPAYERYLEEGDRRAAALDADY
jgi:hypothetical protein